MNTEDAGLDVTAASRPLSVIDGRDFDVLQAMLAFYRPGSLALDVTANARRMWQGVKWPGKVTYCDIDPTVGPDVVCDFRDLPFEADSHDLIVFDPPHLPAASASPKSMQGVSGYEFGLEHAPAGNNVSPYFAPFLREAVRVLRKDGLIFAKLKDYVHNHRYQWTLTDFISAVRGVPGLTPCDLIVKRDPCGGNLKSGRWKHSHHVRNAHCWWVVVRKGRCERTT